MVGFPPPTEQQARVIWLALSGLAIAILVALAGGLIWAVGQVLRLLAPVLFPIAVAGIIAYLLDPVVDLLARRGIRRPRAIIVVFTLALLTLALVASSVVPQLVQQTRELASRVPVYAESMEARIESWVNHPPVLLRRLFERKGPSGKETEPPAAANEAMPPSGTGPQPVGTAGAPAQPGSALDQQALQKATDWLVQSLPQVGSWLFGQVGRVASWFGVLAGFALIPVYCFYFLLEKRGISTRWTDYLPVTNSRFKTELVFVLNAINNYLIAFFRGQVLVALCDGILYGVGFWLVGLPYALLIGVVAVFLTMIPFLGAFVTCLTALAVAIARYGDWQHPLLVLAVFGVVQALEGLVISPRIMGGRVGLHPVTIIIAVVMGTTLLGGLLGGILAIPLTAALRVVMFRYIWKRPGRVEAEPGPLEA